ncbi:MAG: GNAT family N-acetyltransferase [Spirochaetales bacterium]|nr:GNAT family N-acetyltransferase [Spirochaetales bacterium]
MFFKDIDLHDDELKLVLRETKEAIPERKHVPAYCFDIALLDGTVVGNCSLKIWHTPVIWFAGNIGYEVYEPYRGHHYAAKACRLLYPLAIRHKLDYLIITCNVSNAASERSIQLAGGMFIAEQDVPQDYEQYRKGSKRVRIYKVLLHDMRKLFDLDRKDYDEKGPIHCRHSVRGIIIRDGKIAMVFVQKHGCYKFPGGGSEGDETKIETLIREVREEAGLVVKPETARPYGIVTRSQLSRIGDRYCQDNFYYLCDAEDRIVPQELTQSESESGYKLEFVDPHEAIRISRASDYSKNRFIGVQIERETRVLEKLIEEGYFK